MFVRYELEIASQCPVDGLPDIYSMVVLSQRTISVEEILAAAKEATSEKKYQEELCQSLHRKINATVVLTGLHSGVRVVCRCGELT
jgi:hypothetical protein